MENRIISPCRKICQLNESEICIGCGRTLNEIAKRSTYTQDERIEKMKIIKKRLSKD